MRVPDAHEDPELPPEDREVVATPREHFDGDHLGTRSVKFTKISQQEFADFQHCSRSIESRRFENYLADFFRSSCSHYFANVRHFSGCLHNV